MKLTLKKSFLFLILFLSFVNFAFTQTERDNGIKMFMQGKYDDAAASLKKAVEQNDKDLQALNYLSWTFEKQNKTIEAAKIYKNCGETFVILIEEQLREKLGGIRQANNKESVKDFVRKNLGVEFSAGMACANGLERTNPKKATSEDWQTKMLLIAYFGESAEIQVDSETDKNSATNVKIIKKPFPQYTESARASLANGVIRLYMLFASNGKIGFIVPLNYLPNGLTESAMNAAKGIKFNPATKDGKPISVVKQIEYSFLIY